MRVRLILHIRDGRTYLRKRNWDEGSQEESDGAKESLEIVAVQWRRWTQWEEPLLLSLGRKNLIAFFPGVESVVCALCQRSFLLALTRSRSWALVKEQLFSSFSSYHICGAKISFRAFNIPIYIDTHMQKLFTRRWFLDLFLHTHHTQLVFAYSWIASSSASSFSAWFALGKREVEVAWPGKWLGIYWHIYSYSVVLCTACSRSWKGIRMAEAALPWLTETDGWSLSSLRDVKAIEPFLSLW